MNEASVGVGIAEQTQDEYDLTTVEADAEKEIQRLRDRANDMEVALARAPATIRKMTRIQARKLGIHF